MPVLTGIIIAKQCSILLKGCCEKKSMRTVKAGKRKRISHHVALEITVISRYRKKCSGDAVAILFKFTDGSFFFSGVTGKFHFPSPAEIVVGFLRTINKTKSQSKVSAKR